MKEIYCESWEESIADALFGDLSEDQLSDLMAHLADCKGCRTTYEGMRATLDLIPEPVREDPGPMFWRRFDRKLTSVSRAPLVHRLPRWTARVAAAVVLVSVGLLLGRALFAPPTAPPSSEVVLQQSPSEEALAYFGRSRTLLIGLVNEEGDAAPELLNLDRRRAMAGELAAQAAPLRERLGDDRKARLSQLVADLEVILLQIANLEEDPSGSGIELVRQGVDRKALLFKIDVEELRTRDALPVRTDI